MRNRSRNRRIHTIDHVAFFVKWIPRINRKFRVCLFVVLAHLPAMLVFAVPHPDAGIVLTAFTLSALVSIYYSAVYASTVAGQGSINILMFAPIYPNTLVVALRKLFFATFMVPFVISGIAFSTLAAIFTAPALFFTLAANTLLAAALMPVVLGIVMFFAPLNDHAATIFKSVVCMIFFILTEALVLFLALLLVTFSVFLLEQLALIRYASGFLLIYSIIVVLVPPVALWVLTVRWLKRHLEKRYSKIFMYKDARQTYYRALFGGGGRRKGTG